MAHPPGTVSKILWHFTGGPRWNEARNRQEALPKPQEDAYEAFLSILRSKELRLGQYREIVRVRVPLLRRRDVEQDKPLRRKNTVVELRSAAVCCLADIPIAHLSYQAKRYGKMIIGFHRQAAVRHGFNPVFYTLHDTKVVRSIHEGLSQLREVREHSLKSIEWNIESQLEELCCEHGHLVDTGRGAGIDIGWEMDDLGNAVIEAQRSMREFLAFVKTFNEREFATIYCEREWRSTRSFSFKPNQVAMIVLPNVTKNGYFTRFVNEHARKLKIPRSIPIVPWEDLLEH